MAPSDNRRDIICVSIRCCIVENEPLDLIFLYYFMLLLHKVMSYIIM